MVVDRDKLAVLEQDLKKYPAVLTPDQVAEILQVSRKTVDEYIKDGFIEGYPLDPTKQRKQFRVTKAALMAYLTNKKPNEGDN